MGPKLVCSRKVLAYFHGHPTSGLSIMEETFWRTLIGDRTANSRSSASKELEKYYHAWLTTLNFINSWFSGHHANTYHNSPKLVPRFPTNLYLDLEEIATWATMVECCAVGRRLGVTELKRVGMVLRRARKGDIVAVIGGVGTPYILRLCRGMKIVYKLIGECYNAKLWMRNWRRR
jgi:hypothetical protein